MKIKIVVALYWVVSPDPNTRDADELMEGTFSTAVFKKEIDYTLPLELKSKLQIGTIEGFGPLIVGETRNDGTLENPVFTVELEHKVFEDDKEGFLSAARILYGDGFQKGKHFTDTKSILIIFPSSELRRANTWR